MACVRAAADVGSARDSIFVDLVNQLFEIVPFADLELEVFIDGSCCGCALV